MSVYAELNQVSHDIAKDACENPKTENFASGAAVPAAAGIMDAVVPGSGIATSVIMGGLSRSHKKDVAVAATTAATGVGIIAASFLVIPAAIGYGLYNGIKKLFD